MSKQGFFVVIEGIDGCGKTTQCQMLAEWFRKNHGQETLLVHDPGVTRVALACRQLVLDPNLEMSGSVQAMLYLAARTSLAEYIMPQLENGKIVISDRWTLSTLIYQGRMGGVHESVIHVIHNHMVRLDPDVYIVLDVPVEVGMARVRQAKGEDAALDRFEVKGEDWLNRLRDEYLRYGRRADDVHVVDGRQPPRDVFREIIAVCRETSPDFAQRFVAAV